jgi:hypothetical protein
MWGSPVQCPARHERYLTENIVVPRISAFFCISLVYRYRWGNFFLTKYCINIVGVNFFDKILYQYRWGKFLMTKYHIVQNIVFFGQNIVFFGQNIIFFRQKLAFFATSTIYSWCCFCGKILKENIVGVAVSVGHLTYLSCLAPRTLEGSVEPEEILDALVLGNLPETL